MLELAASIWLYALIVTASLFVGVLLVQGVVRRARSAVRVVHRVAAPASAPVPAQAPAAVRQLATSGASAA